MNKKTVWIMQGVSGAGKSSYIPPGAYIVSADRFFEKFGGFNWRRLDEAHEHCLGRFNNALLCGYQFIVVDNTNTKVKEVERYYNLAHDLGYDVIIKHIPCKDLSVCASRNVHNVPLTTIQKQARRIENFAKQMPFWWNRETVEVKS